MMRLVLKIALPFLLSVGFFAYLDVYSGESTNITRDGRDPWALFVVAVGTASAPAVLALLVAGLTKLLKRSSVFSNVWSTAFIFAFCLIAVSSFVVARTERNYDAELQVLLAKQCDITAPFGRNATVNALTPPAQTSGQNWRFVEIYPTGFSSLDCYAVGPEQLFGPVSEADILIAWAAQEGLTAEEFTSADSPISHRKMMASKMVDGRDVIFDYRLFVFDDSFVLAGVAEERATFRSRWSVDFMLGLENKEQRSQ